MQTLRFVSLNTKTTDFKVDMKSQWQAQIKAQFKRKKCRHFLTLLIFCACVCITDHKLTLCPKSPKPKK